MIEAIQNRIVIHQKRAFGPRRVRIYVTIVCTTMTIGRAIIKIRATIKRGIMNAPPSTRSSANTGKIGIIDAKLVVPAIATPNSESTIAKRMASPMKIIGNAKTSNMTLSTILRIRLQPVFCDLSTFTFGRRLGPNSEGSPICDLTELTISKLTTCTFFAKSAF